MLCRVQLNFLNKIPLTWSSHYKNAYFPESLFFSLFLPYISDFPNKWKEGIYNYPHWVQSSRLEGSWAVQGLWKQPRFSGEQQGRSTAWSIWSADETMRNECWKMRFRGHAAKETKTISALKELVVCLERQKTLIEWLKNIYTEWLFNIYKLI